MPQPAIRLEIIAGPDKDRRLVIERPTSGRIAIGREVDRDKNLCLDNDLRVSRLHVEIEPSPDGYWVIDRSLNGTARNGDMLPPREPVRLHSGDRLQLSPHTFVEFEELAELPLPLEATPVRRVPTRPASVTKKVLEPAAAFGDFDIFEAIASSESDRVDRAIQRGTGVEVALKQYTYRLITDRLKREIREETERARDWVHPNIVRLVDVGEVGKTLYVATELVDGEVLSTLQERCTAEIDVCLATYVVREACLAIAYLLERQRDYVHRHLGPHGLMLDRHGRVVLVNYGSPPFEMRISGGVSGSRFQANEARGNDKLDARADVCSLGRVLYELLSREAINARSLVFLKTICPDVPPTLAKITDKAVSLIANRRFPTAAVLAEELTRCLDQLDPHYGPEAAAAWMARFCPRG